MGEWQVTVNELIDLLKMYPGDWPVYAQDGGFASSSQPVYDVVQPGKFWGWEPLEKLEIVS